MEKELRSFPKLYANFSSTWISNAMYYTAMTGIQHFRQYF